MSIKQNPDNRLCQCIWCFWWGASCFDSNYFIVDL